jgi:hypothetical protein
MLTIAGVGLGIMGATGYALRRWSGGWRWIASAPLLYVGTVALKIILEVQADPTSHHLWPFELLAPLAVASAVLGALYVVQLFTKRTGAN